MQAQGKKAGFQTYLSGRQVAHAFLSERSDSFIFVYVYQIRERAQTTLEGEGLQCAARDGPR